MIDIKFIEVENKTEVWINGLFEGDIKEYEGEYIFDVDYDSKYYTASDLRLIARKLDEKNKNKR